MSYPSMFADVVKQLTSRHILHDHEEIRGCTYHLVPKTQTYVSIGKNVQYVNTLNFLSLKL